MKRVVPVVIALAIVLLGAQPGSASAAANVHHALASQVREDGAVTVSILISDSLIRKAAPYVHAAASGRATLSGAAATALTRDELRSVTKSIAAHNSLVLRHEATGVASSADGLSPSTAGAAAKSTGIHKPSCAWHISWSSHWYGETITANACLVNWLSDAANAAAGLGALTAAIQGFLDVPNDVAAIVAASFWAASGLLSLQLVTCQHLGHSGISWTRTFGGAIVPGCS